MTNCPNADLLRKMSTDGFLDPRRIAGEQSITEDSFDFIFPEFIRRRSFDFWTPVEVARRAAEFLAPEPDARVLDVGSGVGKFWSKGYDGVTIDDLVAGMGVGRPSLYAVFGDKRTLFLRVLRAYAEKKGARAAKALLSPQALRASLASFLRHAVESATEEGSAVGCLLVCVAPLVDDAEVRQFLQNAAAGGVAMVERRFRDGISAGEIPSDFPVAVRASQVTDLARGLTMRAQMGMPRKTLLKDAEEAADLVLLPRGTSHGPSGSARKGRTVRR